MDEVLRYWPILVFAMNLLIGWVLWSMTAKFATKNDIAELQKKVRDDVQAVSGSLGAVSGRVAVIESELEHIPNSTQLHETNIRLERVIGQLEAAKSDYGHILNRQARLEDGLIRHDQILSDAARGR
ncbi:DUF2730 family protein [Mesorhizobium sp. KR1-2]|uniref:DUF2730 family protein n=1 Tax=Mesorhizobium sp. KR1-2 TaxID=3156609 RepID=UPI0032B49AAB